MRISCYGWGNPPIPEDLEDLKAYISEFNVAGGAPKWLGTLVSMLVEGNTGVDIVTGKNREWYLALVINIVLTYFLAPMNWIHYERAPFMPSNFVANGDAVMRVNPSFG